MVNHEFYPQREPIYARSFALRHMLIEDIKFRQSAERSSPLTQKYLQKIARELTVSLSEDHKQFEIYLNASLCLKMNLDEITLFLRGDTKAGVEAQKKLDLLQNQQNDLVLEHNRQVAEQIVDSLIDMARASPPDKTNGPAFDGLSCLVALQSNPTQTLASLKELASVLHEIIDADIIGFFEIVLVVSEAQAVEFQKYMTDFPELRLEVLLSAPLYSEAFYAALATARYEVIMFTELSGEFRYTEIGSFLELLRETDAVIGYRPTTQVPLVRRLNEWGWNLLVIALFGRLSRDIDCAFKIFQRSSLDQINPLMLRSQSNIINTEILVRLKQNRLRVREINVQNYPRELHERVGRNMLVILRSFLELLGLSTRLFFERLGWFGFVTGGFSRSHRPMEVIQFRRSELVLDEPGVHCRLCGASGDAILKTQLKTCADWAEMGMFRVFYCLNCRNGFTQPTLLTENRILPPDTTPSHSSWIQRKLLVWFISLRTKRIFKAIKNNQGNNRIIDVGGGSCAFANQLAREGCEVYVFEPNPENQKFVENPSKVHFIPRPFEVESVMEFGLRQEKFDAITFWHSLEHVPEPHETLQLAKSLLKPGGCLYICVPNLNSFQADIGGNHWAYLDVPHHLSHFTLDGLVHILKKEQFEKFSVEWFSPEYEIFGFYQTLLNMFSRSHNYYYNMAKKNRTREQLKYPLWTKLVNRLGFIFLPLALILSIWADFAGKSACVEIRCYNE